MEIAYLACPYSDPDPKVKEMRQQIATKVAYQLLRKGIHVYSVLTHNVPIDQLGIHGEWTAWKNFDHEMLSRCDRLIVLKLPGWEKSKGLAAEIAFAKEKGMPIEWMDPPPDVLQIQISTQSQPLQDVVQRLLAFAEERDWSKFHSPKNLAMNLGVETGELMEHFRWLTEAQSFVEDPAKLAGIRDEIGDVFWVLLHLSHTLGINPIEALHDKMTKTAEKYPVEKCKGKCHKYTEYGNKE